MKGTTSPLISLVKTSGKVQETSAKIRLSLNRLGSWGDDIVQSRAAQPIRSWRTSGDRQISLSAEHAFINFRDKKKHCSLQFQLLQQTRYFIANFHEKKIFFTIA